MSNFLRSTGLNRKIMIRGVLLVSMVTLGLSAISVANAQVYRYTDEGIITYGDYVPLSGKEDGHSVLSNQGVVLEEVKSREERRIARIKEAEAKKVRMQDRTLLKTFTEEEDLIRTRDERLGLLDGQIDRLDDRVRIMKESRLILVQRIQEAENDKGVGKAPSYLYAENDRAKKKTENIWALIDSKAADRKKIATKFESDLDRYRWLRSGGADQ